MRELSNILMETGIAISSIEYEIDTTNDVDPTETIEPLSYELGVLQTIHIILKTNIVTAIQKIIKDKVIKEFEVDEDIFTLYSYHELTTDELKTIAKLLGCKYYSNDCDIGEFINWWTNNEMEV